MKHCAYLAMILFTLFGSIWLEFIFHLRVIHQVKSLLLSVLPFAFLYLTWDGVATHKKDWGFDSSQTLNMRPLLHLPLEELAFFLVIPLAAILTWEAVVHRKPHLVHARNKPHS
jgi:lycopene cyclase domain-containing protein